MSAVTTEQADFTRTVEKFLTDLRDVAGVGVVNYSGEMVERIGAPVLMVQGDVARYHVHLRFVGADEGYTLFLTHEHGAMGDWTKPEFDNLMNTKGWISNTVRLFDDLLSRR